MILNICKGRKGEETERKSSNQERCPINKPVKGAVIRATKSCNSSRNICDASCRVNVVRITTLILLRHCVARSRSSFYSLQQRKFVARRVVIQATFALQLATQQCCATSCTILLLVLPHLKKQTRNARGGMTPAIPSTPYRLISNNYCGN